ncbi:hypothetical protein RJ640_011792 [Escallonia rubra]|uniref:Cation/H+ exchanger domain-containing protein n=1 Tax=Escallonia rubra TaxID=112253 RepID=A0AA88UT99_9ASTE|nr:hypothetical protein RJ640_011792 [Escallonia rubra]
MNDTQFQQLNHTVLCYAETIYRFNGVWEGPDPLSPILPLFILQITIAIFATRLFVLLLRAANQPPFVGEILSGIILGPSGLGRIETYRTYCFPTYALPVLEPMAHFALVCYAFLMGLEMDLRSVWRTGRKAKTVAAAGILIPFCTGAVCFIFFLDNQVYKTGYFFWGFALSVTGYSVLCRLLEKQKTLHTEPGKTAMSAALVTDFLSWASLTIALATSSGTKFAYPLLGMAALAGSVKYARPALLWVIRRTPEGQGYSEYYVCSVLTGAFLFGVVTDVLGTHPMIGAFMFGLIIPNEVLEATLVERLEDFVMGILMPAFFAVCGIRTNVDVIASSGASYVGVAFVMVMFCFAKVVSTIIASISCNMPLREALHVGLLMNTKSIMAMILLEVGQQQGALNTQAYTIMVVPVLVMTIIASLVPVLQHPSRNVMPYKRRTVQKSRPEEELRILACIQGMRNVPSIINLLEASNATQRSPISVFVLYLVELVGRASAAITVHSARKAGPRNPNHEEAQIDQIISAFDNYELRCDGATVQALTARSAYSTMDEDICSIVKDKRVAIIILPFHKLQTLDGDMEDINPAFRSVNENVLANAPCSVGILIDRGQAETGQFPHRVAVLYFGGPDDREALAYAWRMSEHSAITLTVVRFIAGKDAPPLESMEFMSKAHGAITVNIDSEREKVIDDEFLSNFKIATVNAKSVTYSELVLNDEEETVGAIKSLDEGHDLYVVGKGRGMVSPLTAGLADWCDCPELGPVGDLLVTSEFSSAFSVLVVQQYARVAGLTNGSVSPASTANHEEDLGEMDWRPSEAETDAFGSFGSNRRDRDHSH